MPLALGSIGLSNFEEEPTRIIRNVTESHRRTIKSPVTRMMRASDLALRDLLIIQELNMFYNNRPTLRHRISS